MEQTIDQEFINKLARSIANVVVNPIPIDQVVWSADDCANYLRMEKRTFTQYYAPHPKFPKPIPLDRVEGKGQMRWKAKSVIDWAMKNEGKIS